jgi:hypothetical protein
MNVGTWLTPELAYGASFFVLLWRELVPVRKSSFTENPFTFLLMNQPGMRWLQPCLRRASAL